MCKLNSCNSDSEKPTFDDSTSPLVRRPFSTLTTSILLLFGLVIEDANARPVLQPGTTGTIKVTSGCFDFGPCSIGGKGNISDNGILVNGIGSSIDGDGLIGIMNFTVGTDGNTVNITSFSMDAYTGTAGGNFVTRMVSTSSAQGTIQSSGEMTLNLTGRTGLAQFFTVTPGEQPWNLDTHGPAQTFCPGTGVYTLLTTGLHKAVNCNDNTSPWEVAGSTLTFSVDDTTKILTATGTIASAGNVGASWGGFDGTPYSEIFNITVTGTVDPGFTTDPCQPDDFSFPIRTSVPLSTLVESEARLIKFSEPTCNISVENGQYQIDSNDWTSSPGIIKTGQSVRVRHTSSSNNEATTTTTLRIKKKGDGFFERTFSSTTVAKGGRNNFTMINEANVGAGGTNDVEMWWDGVPNAKTGTLNTSQFDTNFNMDLRSSTPFKGANWTAHHIRVFGPGTYTFNSGCTAAEVQANGGQNCAFQGPELKMTIPPGHIGAHMLFDWNTQRDIDVVNVWKPNGIFGPKLFPEGSIDPDTVFEYASIDADGDGIPGIPMVDGDFKGFSANFNLGGKLCTPQVDCPPPPTMEAPETKARGCAIGTESVSPLSRGDLLLLLGMIIYAGIVRLPQSKRRNKHIC